MLKAKALIGSCRRLANQTLSPKRKVLPWPSICRVGPHLPRHPGSASAHPPGDLTWRRVAWAAELDDDQYGGYLMDDFNY